MSNLNGIPNQNNALFGKQSIRIAIVDDHEVVRQGLCTMLQKEDDIEIVGQASDATSGISVIENAHPDVVLLDVHLVGEDINGFELARMIKSNFPTMNVLMLTGYDYELYMIDSIRAKVDGFILKEHPREVLSCAIRMVHAGISVWDKEIFYRAIGNLSENRNADDAGATYLTHKKFGVELNMKERQVLHLLAKGFSNKEIGNQLAYSDATVKKHVYNCMKKLGVTNRTQLAILSNQGGLK
ncbi:MAG: response regulator transcription factor [Dehalogenimonas sp.]